MSLCRPPLAVAAPSPGDALPRIWSFLQQAQVGAHWRRCVARFAPAADFASPRPADLASLPLTAAVSTPDDAPRRLKSFLKKLLRARTSPVSRPSPLTRRYPPVVP